MIGSYAGVPGAILVAVAAAVHVSRGDRRYWREKSRHAALAVTAIMLLLWPLVFDGIVGFDSDRTVIYTGFFWTVLVLLWSMVTSCVQSASQADMDVALTKTNANIIIGAAFAVGALLSVISGQNKTQSVAGARIMLISLLMCIAFVIPGLLNMNVKSPVAGAVRSAQRGFLHYAMGLFIASIVVSWVES